jgi:hypothetical protein
MISPVSPFVRGVVVAGGIMGVLLFALRSRADLAVTFHAPHVARVAGATLEKDFSRSVDLQIKEARIGSVDELLHFALDVTGADLHFGLAHKTTLEFGSKEREGNCIEYAHLFATVFNRAAERKHVAARAFVVHSDARVLGKKLAVRGLDDHDWVLVVPSAAGAQRLFVDPTFHDFGLGWDIAGSVSGDVRTP